jgi:hypothetical protein
VRRAEGDRELHTFCRVRCQESLFDGLGEAHTQEVQRVLDALSRERARLARLLLAVPWLRLLLEHRVAPVADVDGRDRFHRPASERRRRDVDVPLAPIALRVRVRLLSAVEEALAEADEREALRVDDVARGQLEQGGVEQPLGLLVRPARGEPAPLPGEACSVGAVAHVLDRAGAASASRRAIHLRGDHVRHASPFLQR